MPNNWLSPSSRWPFTGEFFQTLRHHLSICICYLGAESNIVLFSLTRNDVSGLQTAPGGGGKAAITQFSGMTITSYFILVADIFRLEENANIWQTTFSNGFSLVKWLPCGFKEDLFTDYHLHQDDPLQVSSLTKLQTSFIDFHMLSGGGPSLTMSFFLSTGMGSGFGSSKQARTKNLKIPLPRGGLAESGILERAFWGLKSLWDFVLKT